MHRSRGALSSVKRWALVTNPTPNTMGFVMNATFLNVSRVPSNLSTLAASGKPELRAVAINVVAIVARANGVNVKGQRPIDAIEWKLDSADLPFAVRADASESVIIVAAKDSKNPKSRVQRALFIREDVLQIANADRFNPARVVEREEERFSVPNPLYTPRAPFGGESFRTLVSTAMGMFRTLSKLNANALSSDVRSAQIDTIVSTAIAPSANWMEDPTDAQMSQLVALAGGDRAMVVSALADAGLESFNRERDAHAVGSLLTTMRKIAAS